MEDRIAALEELAREESEGDSFLEVALGGGGAGRSIVLHRYLLAEESAKRDSLLALEGGA